VVKVKVIFRFPGATYGQNKEQIKAVVASHGLKWNIKKMLRTETQMKGVWEDGKGNSLSAEFTGSGQPAELTFVGDNETLAQQLKDLADLLGVEVIQPEEAPETGCMVLLCPYHDRAATSYCAEHRVHREQFHQKVRAYAATRAPA